MTDLQFSKVYDFVASKWPDTLCPEASSDLVRLEEGISSSLIGVDYELVYREMSYSIMLVLSEAEELGALILKKEIDRDSVRAKFEERIASWTKEDDGFTSDMKGRRKYNQSNKHNKSVHPSADAPAD